MKNLVVAIAIVFASQLAIGQTYSSKLTESSMTVSGTSTLHDWESDVEDFTALCVIEGEEIESATFSAKVKSIKSGTGSMDENTYEALNAEDHKQITFKSNKVQKSGNNLVVNGVLTIAGESQNIRMNLIMEKWQANSLSVKGEYTLKMTEYGIDPPTAMWGTIKTGNEVTIKFEITLYQ
ncbi:YceI family protein [Halocola ammonii]